MTGMLLLVPSDPLDARRADAHFAPEADAAREVGVPVALIDHDALSRAGTAADTAAAVARVPVSDDAVYRGWMLRSEEYEAFGAALAAREVQLRTSPGQYRQAHELPGWYPALAAETPLSTWTTGSCRADFDRERARLGTGSAVLRDWTKSMKHYWYEAAFIPDVTDSDAAWAVATRFLELRDDAFAGGLVLRRFEELTGAEVRTWWVRGRCAVVGAHPDTPGRIPTVDLDLTGLTDIVAALGMPFVTVDLALRRDRRWRVVELGDGQVSDRPADLDPRVLLAALV